ncbi:MAG: hypothetical protein FH749_00835 [Firmicutes bacterium]|nr:hypothetical protein [Bacillota bacterium]
MKAREFICKHKLGGILACLHRKPLTEWQLRSKLPDRALLGELVEQDLIRRDGKVYRLNLVLLDASDRRLARGVAATFARDLAESFAAQRPDVYSVLARYPNPSVQTDVLAGAAVGCFFLIENSPRYLTESGYTCESLVSPFKPPKLITLPLDNSLFCGFGPEAAQSLPGLLRKGVQGPIAYQVAVNRRLRALAADCAAILAKVSEGETSLRQVKQQFPGSDDLIALLVALGCLDWEGDKLMFLLPWWKPEHGELLRSLEAFLLPVLLSWHRLNYPVLKTSLEALGAIQNGLDFPRVYSLIWPCIVNDVINYLYTVNFLAGNTTAFTGLVRAQEDAK